MTSDRTLYTHPDDDPLGDLIPEQADTATSPAPRASQGLPERPKSYIDPAETASLSAGLTAAVRNQLCILSRILLTMDRKITSDAIHKLWPERATLFEFGLGPDGAPVAPAPEKKAIEAYLGTEDYLDKMAQLGISFREEDDGLSSKQIAFLGLITDITNVTSLSQQLKKVGVSYVEFEAWQLNPTFREAWDTLGKKAVKTAIPLAEMQIARRMANGDQKMIELGFAMTGHYDPARNKQIDAQKMFGILLEIIEEEVKDPSTLQRIGTRLSLSSKKALES